METEFDVIVIGGGPVGENVADHAIRNSDRTAAIVEAELLGGECSYWACMPSKALLRPLEVAATANHLGGITQPVEIDRAALLARRDEWVSHYDDRSQVEWAEGAGLTVVRGRGRISGEREVELTDDEGTTTTLTARLAVVVATGSLPVVPEIFAAINPWTSREATAVTEVPDRLVIIGGGVVACEAAGWMRALGSEVTLLVRGDRLLERAEPFAADLVLAAMREQGIEVRVGVEATSATRDGEVLLDLDGETLACDEVLVATGRKPATAGVDIPEPLPDWAFLVGDVSGEAPLTHWGKYRARLVGETIAARAEGREEPTNPEVVPVPQVVFTDPQVAWVGQTEAEARDAGVDVEVRTADYTSAAGAALLRDDAHGKACLVIDKATGTLVGATFAGPEVAELLHAATVAITGQVPVDTLRHAVASYPTASEIWLRLLDG